LIEGISRAPVGRQGLDSDAIVEQATAQGMSMVILPRKNGKEQRSYDKHLYRHRHLVENAFLHLKRWRGIATRYAKTSHHSWPPNAYDALCFGLPSRDDTI
jgi:transposase